MDVPGSAGAAHERAPNDLRVGADHGRERLPTALNGTSRGGLSCGDAGLSWSATSADRVRDEEAAGIKSGHPDQVKLAPEVIPPMYGPTQRPTNGTAQSPRADAAEYFRLPRERTVIMGSRIEF
jgi:hypothetical protein